MSELIRELIRELISKALRGLMRGLVGEQLDATRWSSDGQELASTGGACSILFDRLARGMATRSTSIAVSAGPSAPSTRGPSS